MSKEPKTFSNSSNCNENFVRGKMCKAPLTGRRRPADLYRAEERLAFIFESREVSDHFCLQHLLQLVAVGTAERSAQHRAAGTARGSSDKEVPKSASLACNKRMLC